MNSRERVRRAIRFEEPDRVPIDVGGSLVTGICIDEYVDLVKTLASIWDCRSSTNSSECWRDSPSPCEDGCIRT